MRTITGLVAGLLLLTGCATADRTDGGETPAANADAARQQLEANLRTARTAFEADPTDEDAIIWYGRRLAYLGRYDEAITVYTNGLRHHPDSFRLRRHRGHRYITTRQLARARGDLELASDLIQDVPDAIEPDGAPNRFNVPRSTTHFNVWYHLALTQYLQGDFPAAHESYRRGMAFSRANDDKLVATTRWYYTTLRRLGRDAEAAALLEPIRPEMDLMENESYQQILLMFKGEVDPETLLDATGDDAVNAATVRFGVAEYYELNGQPERAREINAWIVANTNPAAFGHLGAASRLGRLR